MPLAAFGIQNQFMLNWKSIHVLFSGIQIGLKHLFEITLSFPLQPAYSNLHNVQTYRLITSHSCSYSTTAIDYTCTLGYYTSVRSHKVYTIIFQIASSPGSLGGVEESLVHTDCRSAHLFFHVVSCHNV